MKINVMLTLAVAFAAGLSNAQTASHPDISGFWELKSDSKNVPDAVLTPAAIKAAKEMREKDGHAIRWCNFLGTPFIMGDYGRLDIRDSPFEIAIVPESMAVARHIYVDGRKHISKEIFDPTTNGNSIGTWQGDSLVVDTIGFSDKGVTAIPGGGYRTPDSHLVEKYQLLDNGKKLKVTFTWDDPKVFVKPHTYQFMYYRAIPGTFVREEAACDSNDPERTKLLTETPQP